MVLLIFLSVPDSHLSASPYVFCTQCWRLSIVKVCMWREECSILFSITWPHTHTHTHTPQSHIQTHIHTHTHMHKIQNGKMLGAAISGPHAILQGNSGPALDNLLKLGQAIAGALSMPSSYGVGTLQSQLCLSGAQHSQWSCPSPA